MIYGGVKHIEHYQSLVGEVRGLQMVEDELSRLLKKEESED